MGGIGKSEDKIILNCLSRNNPIPRSILESPKVDTSNLFYLNAFFDLGTCRSVGFDEGRIPWRDIVLYANEKNLTGEFRELFICVILNLDVEYCAIKAQMNEDNMRRKNG